MRQKRSSGRQWMLLVVSVCHSVSSQYYHCQDLFKLFRLIPRPDSGLPLPSLCRDSWPRPLRSCSNFQTFRSHQTGTPFPGTVGKQAVGNRLKGLLVVNKKRHQYLIFILFTKSSAIKHIPHSLANQILFSLIGCNMFHYRYVDKHKMFSHWHLKNIAEQESIYIFWAKVLFNCIRVHYLIMVHWQGIKQTADW